MEQRLNGTARITGHDGIDSEYTFALAHVVSVSIAGQQCDVKTTDGQVLKVAREMAEQIRDALVGYWQERVEP